MDLQIKKYTRHRCDGWHRKEIARSLVHVGHRLVSVRRDAEEGERAARELGEITGNARSFSQWFRSNTRVAAGTSACPSVFFMACILFVHQIRCASHQRENVPRAESRC